MIINIEEIIATSSQTTKTYNGKLNIKEIQNIATENIENNIPTVIKISSYIFITKLMCSISLIVVLLFLCMKTC